MRVDREVWTPEGELLSHDVRYFLSSIDPGTVTPEDLARLVRGHWQVALFFLRRQARQPLFLSCAW